jgi:hypothetical protein
MKIVRYRDGSGAQPDAIKGEGIVGLTRHFSSLADNTLKLISHTDLEIQPGARALSLSAVHVPRRRARK